MFYHIFLIYKILCIKIRGLILLALEKEKILFHIQQKYIEYKYIYIYDFLKKDNIII